jgi:hypothetical protein
MIINVSYNKKLIVLLGFVSCVILVSVIAALFFVYSKPLGFIQINYGNASVELTYNRFQRVLTARPLNIQAVEPLTVLSLNNTSVRTAYERIILTFHAQSAIPQNPVVRIVQDNLVQAKKIEQSLSLLEKDPVVTFELYTHELYREAAALPVMEHWYPGDNQHMRGRRNWYGRGHGRHR